MNEEVAVADLLEELRTQIGMLSQDLAIQRVIVKTLSSRCESCNQKG